jgi:hypothetical protein
LRRTPFKIASRRCKKMDQSDPDAGGEYLDVQSGFWPRHHNAMAKE